MALDEAVQAEVVLTLCARFLNLLEDIPSFEAPEAGDAREIEFKLIWSAVAVVWTATPTTFLGSCA